MSSADQLPKEVEELFARIEEFATEFVGNTAYHPRLPKNPKIVHDPLWGTIKLEPWEVALLDLPLFQRLRQIHQTSLVSYVFPGCSHTRFEHTLGVMQQTQKLVDAVNGQSNSTTPPYDHNLIRNLRLAALFHDCGHSCFSHISEELYRSCPDIVALFNLPDFPKCNPHEAMSALILKSKPVKEYLQKLEAHYGFDFNLTHAANYIMGVQADPTNAPDLFYDTQVISGPFDADKLDYLFRDAHYSGIPIGLDLDRLWANCAIARTTDGKKVLTLHQSSVAPLEQILFSKANLFAIVYQHPKVRAAEKMFHSVIEMIKNTEGELFKVSGKLLKFKHATDYLWLTDEGFFCEAYRRPPEDPIHKTIHNIRYRRFPVRALTISNDTVSDKCKEQYLQFRKLNQDSAETYTAKRELANKIIETAGLQGKISPFEVWVDVPKDPKFSEADRTIVRTSVNELRTVSDFFPILYWAELYQKYKWRSHVFCPQEYQQEIHSAAIKYFKDALGLEFKKSAGEISHVPSPIDSCT